VLTELGSPVEASIPRVAVADTRTNIKLASTAELEEIDTRYPQFIKRITPEHFEDAISALTRAWMAEKQHRDLVMQLITGSGILFGIMAKTIEGNPVDYFVCQGCGSTLVEVPREKCPVCSGPLSNYIRVDPGTSARLRAPEAGYAYAGCLPGLHLMLHPRLGLCSPLTGRSARTASSALLKSSPVTGMPLPGLLESIWPL
jgi:rubrerythrin